tara:strand:- start:10844 stop:11215 length:372 start_codon:yes stop_codon:yes gene_type:complete
VVRLHETSIGRKFYEHDFPGLVTEMRELNGSLQQLLELQLKATDMLSRIVASNAPESSMKSVVYKYDYRLGKGPKQTKFFSNAEEFMYHIKDEAKAEFSTEVEFGRWMLTNNFKYEVTNYYEP